MNIDFQYPILLWLLVLIPIIFLISRIIPPIAKSVFLPSSRFLIGLDNKGKTINDAPLFIKIIRSLLFTTLILFFANPINKAIQKPINQKTIVFIIDNSFLNANDFNNIKENITDKIDNYGDNNFYYFILTAQNKQNLSKLTQNTAKKYLDEITIRPNLSYPELAIKSLANIGYDKAFYYSDNQEYEKSNLLLKSHKNLEIHTNKNPISLIVSVKNENNYHIETQNHNSKPIFEFYKNKTLIHTSQTNNINKALINGSNFIKIKDQNNTGGVYILDAQNKPRAICLLENNQNNLSDNNFIIAALNQINTPKIGNIKNLSKSCDTIIIGDYALNKQEQTKAYNFIANGGNIIRYIGANAISNIDDKIVTVKFDKEPKIISGDLSSFENYIAPFAQNSPLFGIEYNNNDKPLIIAKTIDEDNAKIWARMNDGSAIISAKSIGRGNLINIHTSASNEWSGIALSGLQVKILRRLIAIEPNEKIELQGTITNQSLKPVQVLDGYGNFQTPNNIASIPSDYKIESANIDYPPGIYEADNFIKIIEPLNKDFKLKPLNINGFTEINMGKINSVNYSKILLGIAAILFLIDCTLSNRTKFNKFWLILLFILPIHTNAEAQTIALPYILTKDTEINNNAKLGLTKLASALKARTNFEPMGAIGIDLNKTDIDKYPIIYWLLPSNNQILSDLEKDKLNHYIKNGGILFIDTRGQSQSNISANRNLSIAINGLSIPSLMNIPSDSVIYKSFYLLRAMTGRYGSADISISNQNFINSQNDGVSPIIITNGDFANAWLKTDNEMAIRTGINIYIYALTGQYKNDQTHLNAILERLKQKKPN